MLPLNTTHKLYSVHGTGTQLVCHNTTSAKVKRSRSQNKNEIALSAPCVPAIKAIYIILDKINVFNTYIVSVLDPRN